MTTQSASTKPYSDQGEGMGDLIFKLRVLRWMVTNAYEEWRDSVWRRDLDSTYCCDGRECCCRAETVREMWSWHLKKETGA